MRILSMAFLLLAVAAGATGDTTEVPGRIVEHAADMQFGACPPGVDFPCEMAVLEGNPGTEGMFTMRVRTTGSWLLPPHTHPRHERVTVLSGKISVGFGESVDKSTGTTFTTGDYYVNPPGAVHYVWADEAVEIQITGMGPWEVHPVEK